MTIVTTLLVKERMRNQNMMDACQTELSILPKGSIRAKTTSSGTYYYLNYRSDKRVISKYIGKDKAAVEAIKEQLARRVQIEFILKQLRQEQQQIKKLEALL